MTLRYSLLFQVTTDPTNRVCGDRSCGRLE